MKTYCTEEMVGLECNEWVPADVARELFEALKYQKRMQDGDARCELQTFLHLRDSALQKACGD